MECLIKKYMAALKRKQNAPQKFYFPNLYGDELRILTSQAQTKDRDSECFSSRELTIAYAREFDRLNGLVHVEPVFVERAPVQILSISLPPARWSALAAGKTIRARRSRAKDAYFEKNHPLQARIAARDTCHFVLRDIAKIKKTSAEWIVSFA